MQTLNSQTYVLKCEWKVAKQRAIKLHLFVVKHVGLSTNKTEKSIVSFIKKFTVNAVMNLKDVRWISRMNMTKDITRLRYDCFFG